MVSRDLHPRHEAFDNVERRRNSPIEVMMDLRSGVESLPKTSSSFKLNNVLDRFDAAAVHPTMLTILGSWKVPETVVAGDRVKGARYVNPDYIHAHRLSDAYSWCDCGALVIRQNQQQGARDVESHREGCKLSSRYRARAEVWEKRAEVITEVLLAGRSGRSASRRLGADREECAPTINRLEEHERLNTAALKERGRELRLNTEMYLLASGYDTDEVGQVWDVSASTIRERIARKTDLTTRKVRAMEP